MLAPARGTGAADLKFLHHNGAFTRVFAALCRKLISGTSNPAAPPVTFAL